MNKTVNMLGLQISIAVGDKKKNLAYVESLLSQHCRPETDLVVLPELFTTGYSWADTSSLSETKDDKTTALISKWAKDFDVNIVAGSIIERRNAFILNTSFIFDRKGQLIGSYSKTHLFSPIGEDDYFDHGSEVGTFDLDIGRVGCALCYDIRFPELIRKLALKNIDILTLPAAFPSERIKHLKALCVARAIENEIFVIALNRTGSDEAGEYGGRSLVVDPWGNILYEAGPDAEVFDCELELSSLDVTRAKIPVFADRRPEVY